MAPASSVWVAITALACATEPIPADRAAIDIGCEGLTHVSGADGGPFGIVGPIGDVSRGGRIAVIVGESGILGQEVAPESVALTMTHEGESVPGEWVVDPASSNPQSVEWVFEPLEPFPPATTYTWTAETDQRCADGTFTTSTVGLAVTDPGALIGQTFGVTPNASWIQPEMFLLGISVSPWWIRFDDLQDRVARVTMAHTSWDGEAPGDPLVQHTCETTVELHGAWDGARLTLETDDLELLVGVNGSAPYFFGPAEPTVVRTTDLTLNLTVSPDGQDLFVDRLAFTADTRSLGDFSVSDSWGDSYAGDGTALNFCNLLALDAIACSPCDDGVETCIFVETGPQRDPGAVPPAMIDVAADQRENHLCADACDNEADDDGDDQQDVDAECDPMAWP